MKDPFTSFIMSSQHPSDMHTSATVTIPSCYTVGSKMESTTIREEKPTKDLL
jgi:hypothetical protein